MLGAAFFAVVAGVLSTLSPCVLPLLPVVLGTAVSQHRFGPVALAGGLAISFVAIGLFVATKWRTIATAFGLFRKYSGARPPGSTSPWYSEGST